MKYDFLNYVKNGDTKPFVSMQIGAGAGFDCKLAGKEWTSQGTIDDTIRAYELVGCEPLINVAIPDLGQVVEQLRWDDNYQATDNARMTVCNLSTPYGDISRELKEQKKHGITPLKYPLTIDSANVFDIVNWYAEQCGKAVPYFGELIKPVIDNAHKAGPISVQWNVQPFELFGLISVENLAMLAMLYKDDYRKACDLIRQVNIDLIKEAFKANADFIFLGAPGSEMLSPSIYEDYIVPDSRIITDAVHEVDGLVYSHICSPIEPFLSKGFYNQMGIDLFETLSPPPVGNVTSLADARKIMNDNVCTRGNIGLDILLNGSLEEIEKATIDVLEATRGSKHLVAASDYLFYDIPLENVKQVVKTVNSNK